MQITRSCRYCSALLWSNRRPSDSSATPSADVRFDQKFELESVTRLSFSGLSHGVALGLSFDVASRVIEAATAKHGQACHQVALIQGQNSGRRRLATGGHRGQLMQRLKIAQLFGAPKSARKTKARLAGAQLLI